MGQKTHPIGFRLGINKPWTSNWYGGKKYSDYVAEDIILRKYINQRLSNAGISSISIDRTSKKLTITINTSRPGIVIGKGGKTIENIKKQCGVRIRTLHPKPEEGHLFNSFKISF